MIEGLEVSHAVRGLRDAAIVLDGQGRPAAAEDVRQTAAWLEHTNAPERYELGRLMQAIAAHPYAGNRSVRALVVEEGGVRYCFTLAGLRSALRRLDDLHGDEQMPRALGASRFIEYRVRARVVQQRAVRADGTRAGDWNDALFIAVEDLDLVGRLRDDATKRTA